MANNEMHRNAFHPVLKEIRDLLKAGGIEVSNFPKTAFGDTRTAELSPLASWTFIYNINPDIIKSTITGAGSLSQANSKAILSTGAAINSSTKIETRKHIRYTPGLGNLVRMTGVFSLGKTGSEQTIGIGDELDGFFFGYRGTTFGIAHRQNGAETFIPQSSWSEKTLLSGDFTLNKQVGNVYIINYQWLGYGQISFYVEDPDVGIPIMVHRIKYANSSPDPHIFNPSLPIMAEVINTTNNTEMILETPSATGFVEGDSENESAVTVNYIQNENISVHIDTSGLQVPLILRPKELFQGKKNRVTSKPIIVNASNTSSASTINVHVIRNFNFDGPPPAFTDINSDSSTVEYSFNPGEVNILGGKTLFTFTLPPLSSKEINLQDLNLFFSAGENIGIGCHNISGTTGMINVAYVWKEYF